MANGTPQGSVISPVLFNIMINDIMICDTPNGFGVSRFADDVAIWKRGRNLDHVHKQLQEALDKVVMWAEEWGFKISVAKSKYVVFGFKKKASQQILRLYNKPVERVKILTFLGVWFEEKMTWRVHVEKTVAKCEKVINVTRCLVGSDWGVDRGTLMMIYRAIIRSAIDYGCMAYGTAAPSVLKRLDVVQAKALRICCGAFRTTPINALLIEMGETTLELRRNKLSLNYRTKLQSSRFLIPAQCLLGEHWEFQGRVNSSMVNSIGERAWKVGVKDLLMGPAVCWPPVPPWLLPEPDVDLSKLDQIKKKDAGDPVTLVNNYLKGKWADYIQIYTDGSKNLNNGKATIGISIPQIQIQQGKQISNYMSVFTTELVAILWALGCVEEVRLGKIIICSDSTAALMALKGGESGARPDLIVKIMTVLNRVSKLGNTVGFFWVPAHVGAVAGRAFHTWAFSEVLHSPTQINPPLNTIIMIPWLSTIHLDRNALRV